MASASIRKYEESLSDYSVTEESVAHSIDYPDYHAESGKIINERYTLLNDLGRGAFSNVVKAYDKQDNKYVALKIIKQSKKLTKRALYEIELMKKIKNYEEDSKGKNFFATYLEHFTCNEFLFISIELLSMTLRDAINNSMSEGLPLTAIRSIGYQLFHGLRILSKPELNIIHGDLKPENLIFSNRDEYQVKICDFGCAQIENQKKYSIVGTSLYRAPEVTLGIDYKKNIDMWSAGCVLAEAYIGSILFLDSSNIDPFLKIVEFLGMPSTDMLDHSPATRKYFNLNENGIYELKICGKNRSSIDLRNVLFRAASTKPVNTPHSEIYRFLDLLNRIFVYDYTRRMSPEDALHHRFISREVTMGQ